MKKAKVQNGVVQHVWPWVKTMPDGTKVTIELPHHYRHARKPTPHIVDVPDRVKPGWVWDGRKYAPVVKKPMAPHHSDLLEVLAEKLGLSYQELWDEIVKRKKVRRAAKAN